MQRRAIGHIHQARVGHDRGVGLVLGLRPVQDTHRPHGEIELGEVRLGLLNGALRVFVGRGRRQQHDLVGTGRGDELGVQRPSLRGPLAPADEGQGSCRPRRSHTGRRS